MKTLALLMTSLMKMLAMTMQMLQPNLMIKRTIKMPKKMVRMQMKLMRTKEKMMTRTLYHRLRISKQMILMLMPKMMKKLKLTMVTETTKRPVLRMKRMLLMRTKMIRLLKMAIKMQMVIKRTMMQLLPKMMMKRRLMNQLLKRLHLLNLLPLKLQVPHSTVKPAAQKYKMEGRLLQVMINRLIQLEKTTTIKMMIESNSKTNQWPLDQIYWTNIHSTYIHNK